MLISRQSLSVNWWKQGSTAHVPLPASCSSYKDGTARDASTWGPDLWTGGSSLCMWAHLLLQEFVPLGLGSSQCSQDVTLEASVLKWKVHCVWHHLRTVALNPALRLCALSGRLVGFAAFTQQCWNRPSLFRHGDSNDWIPHEWTGSPIGHSEGVLGFAASWSLM